MTWQEVCDDKSLQDLPYKIELNQWGQIVMSPASNTHGRHQSRIATWLAVRMPGGEVITECSIDTPKGTKVADVARASDEFLRKYQFNTPYPAAPEICVEVVSPSNSRDEIVEKIMLYLSKGAKEVWICDADGKMAFHDHAGPMKKSKLAPKFPSKV